MHIVLLLYVTGRYFNVYFFVTRHHKIFSTKCFLFYYVAVDFNCFHLTLQCRNTLNSCTEVDHILTASLVLYCKFGTVLHVG